MHIIHILLVLIVVLEREQAILLYLESHTHTTAQRHTETRHGSGVGRCTACTQRIGGRTQRTAIAHRKRTGGRRLNGSPQAQALHRAIDNTKRPVHADTRHRQIGFVQQVATPAEFLRVLCRLAI